MHARQVLGTVAGPLAPMLTAERTALNFLSHLSGVATLAHRFVEAAGPDDHWAATVAPGGERWQLTRTAGGEQQVLATAPGPVHGHTIGFRTGPDTVELVADGLVWATVDAGPAAGTATGIVSTGREVRLDRFAVFVG